MQTKWFAGYNLVLKWVPALLEGVERSATPHISIFQRETKMSKENSVHESQKTI